MSLDRDSSVIIPTKYKWVYVDELGNVYSTARENYGMHKLSQSLGGTGSRYLQVSVVHPDGIRRSTLVHKIVCEAWHGERPDPVNDHPYTVSHLNGNRYDNRRDNLKWELLSDNHYHKFDHGTDDSGWRNSRAKLTKDDLEDIRSRLSSGEETHEAIAKSYGVGRATISKINNGSRYGNV